MSNTETLRAALRAAREARDAIPLGAERSALNVALDRLDVALSAAAALAQPAASGEPVAVVSRSNDLEGLVQWAEKRMPVGAMLYAAQPAPSGWALVPVEPTEAMLAAAMATAERHLLSGEWHNMDCATDKERADKSNRDYYRAMLAAAPDAPQSHPQR